MNSNNENFGFVYVLSIVEIPGVVKVGYTLRTPEDRCKELNGQTGVFFTYRVEHKKLVENPYKYESLVHSLLPKRITKNKEHFLVDVKTAIFVVEHAHFLKEKSFKRDAVRSLEKHFKKSKKAQKQIQKELNYRRKKKKMVVKTFNYTPK